MKLPLLLGCPALLLGVWSGPALAQQTPAAPVAPVVAPDALADINKRSVTLPPGTSRDDDLIALGRAAKINVFADASQWSAEAPALSGPRTGTAPRLLGAQAEQPLSWLGEGDTLLIWTRPDLLALARRIAEGESIGRVALPPAPAPPVLPAAPAAPAAPVDPNAPHFDGIDIKALLEAARAAKNDEAQRWQARWNEYLAQTPGGATRGPGWTRDIALADLPPDLRAFVLAKAQAELLPTKLMAHWKAWVTEEFWKTARLSIRDVETLVAGQKVTDPPQKKAISMLFVSNTLQVTPGQRGNTRMSIANLGEAPAPAAPATP